MNISSITLASANLISNGNFEETSVRDSSWAWFDSGLVNGWEGSNIEIWNAFKSVSAFNGNQHIELNAHGNDQSPYSISQTFETEVGGIYNMSFAYSARLSNDEAFWVNVNADNSSDLFTELMIDHQVGQWSVFNAQFQAVDLSTTLSFTSAKPYYGTVGNFLDNIVVNQILPLQLVSEVSEPFGMLLVGVIFLAVMRNRLLKSIDTKID